MLHTPTNTNNDLPSDSSDQDPSPQSTTPHPTSDHTKPSNSKLIFAPGTDPTSTLPGRAAQFSHGTLSRSQLSPSPLTQFHTWFTSPQLASSVPETCTLSTASLPSGRVSSRMVYLKELDSAGGFVVYSNFGTSQKAKDLESNPWVGLCFWWKGMERQVRVEGRAERLSDGESQVYFSTRARGSRVGAWASRQSEVLRPAGDGSGATGVAEGGAEGVAEEGAAGGAEGKDDGRAQLDRWVKEVEEKFEGQEHIPVPSFWGGLRVVPEMVEFWQGRDSRLHDRFRYTKVEGGEGDGEWKIERLSP